MKETKSFEIETSNLYNVKCENKKKKDSTCNWYVRKSKVFFVLILFICWFQQQKKIKFKTKTRNTIESIILKSQKEFQTIMFRFYFLARKLIGCLNFKIC